MVNRRESVATSGGCAVLPAVSRALEKSGPKLAEATAGARARVDLNGQWEQRFVDQVRFGYKLDQGYARTACRAQVTLGREIASHPPVGVQEEAS